MRLLVVGSADAFNSAGRAHSCYLIEGSAGRVMVDFGATALAALRRLGREPGQVDAIAFTHLHGDHVGGTPFLVIDAMYNTGRTRPLAIVGPVLTADRLDRNLRVAYGGVADRQRAYEVSVQELHPGDVVGLAGYEVRAFRAEHMDPPDQALCLRIGIPGGPSVAFSGDTERCEGLLAAADGADLLVAECTALTPPAGRHLTWVEWRDLLPRVRAKRILMTHLGADVRAAIPRLRAEVPPGVVVEFADDGMMIDL